MAKPWEGERLQPKPAGRQGAKDRGKSAFDPERTFGGVLDASRVEWSVRGRRMTLESRSCGHDQYRGEVVSAHQKPSLPERVCNAALSLGFFVTGILVLMSARKFGSNLPVAILCFVPSIAFALVFFRGPAQRR